MNIGSILKTLRQERKLTQKEFAADIFSHSFYSKIESGEHHIRAEDLFELLHCHEIPLDVFYDYYKTDGETHYHIKQLEKSIMMASYSKDVRMFPVILKEIEQSTLSESVKKRSTAQTKLVWAIAAKDKTVLPKEDEKHIKEYLFAKEDWSNSWLALLSNSLSLFDITDISVLIQTILTKELKDVNHVNFDRLVILYSLCINYIYKCLEKDLEHFVYFPLSCLNEIPDHFYFILHKTHSRFIHLLMDYRKNPSSDIEANIRNIINHYNEIDMSQTAQTFLDLWENYR